MRLSPPLLTSQQGFDLYLLGQNLRLFDFEDKKEEAFLEDLNLDRFIIDKQKILWGAESNNGLQIIDLENKEVLSSYVSNHLNPNMGYAAIDFF